MACSPTNPLGCPGEVIGNVAGSVVTSGWDAICQAWAEAAAAMLKAFANAFVAFPSINPQSPGIRTMYGVSLGIAATVAAGLFLIEVARTAWTHDGSGLARGVIGLGQMALAVMVTLSLTSAGILASNQLAKGIVNVSFQDTDGLENKIQKLVEFQTPGQTSTMLLIIAVVGIILVLVLWFELLLCNAAIAVLIATSPIAAAGQISGATKSWWPKLVSATVQLLILKPAIALVFALGLTITGESTRNSGQDLATMLSGLLILLLATLAWPAIGRLFTFMEVRVGGGSGLAAVLGFAAGRVNGGGSSVGLDPEQFGAMAEARTMSSMGARTAGGSAAAGGAAGGGAGGAAAGGAGAAAGPAAAALAFVDLAQRAANSLVGRMEQTAGNAGLDGPNPHPYVAGYPAYARTGGSSYGAGSGGGYVAGSDGGPYGGDLYAGDAYAAEGYASPDAYGSYGPSGGGGAGTVFDPGPEPPSWGAGGWVPPEPPPVPGPGSEGPGPAPGGDLGSHGGRG